MLPNTVVLVAVVGTRQTIDRAKTTFEKRADIRLVLERRAARLNRETRVRQCGETAVAAFGGWEGSSQVRCSCTRAVGTFLALSQTHASS